jgi:hypothetical protein
MAKKKTIKELIERAEEILGIDIVETFHPNDAYCAAYYAEEVDEAYWLSRSDLEKAEWVADEKDEYSKYSAWCALTSNREMSLNAAEEYFELPDIYYSRFQLKEPLWDGPQDGRPFCRIRSRKLDRVVYFVTDNEGYATVDPGMWSWGTRLLDKHGNPVKPKDSEDLRRLARRWISEQKSPYAATGSNDRHEQIDEEQRLVAQLKSGDMVDRIQAIQMQRLAEANEAKADDGPAPGM